jgi:RNA polymerase sigma-70 factor (ECF subfamily)
LDVNEAAAELSAPDFCSRVHPQLVRSLALYCGDSAVAEELAQEALLRAWDRWGSVRRMTNPTGWVFRVGFNLATSRGRRAAIERRASTLAGADYPQHEDSLDDAIVVRAAVASLPPRERAAIVLRYFADFSVDDTAVAMRCRPGTVKSLTFQAVRRLHDLLGGDLTAEVSIDG